MMVFLIASCLPCSHIHTALEEEYQDVSLGLTKNKRQYRRVESLVNVACLVWCVFGVYFAKCCHGFIVQRELHYMSCFEEPPERRIKIQASFEFFNNNVLKFNLVNL